jgi:predicted transcriptional regulator YdeE
MEPRRIDGSSLLVGGITVRTTNRDEANPASAKLPAQWGRFFAEGLAERIPNRLPDSPVYGVYSAYESDHKGAYDLTAGVAVLQASDNPEFTSVEIASGPYLVFEARGAMPAVVIETWRAVWQYFEDHPEVRRRYATDFEVYRGPDEVAIHVGVLD